MTESNDLVPPPSSVSENAHLKSMEDYQTMYQRSIEDPDGFWAEVAEDFHWYSKWDEVRGYNYDRRQGPISIEWFKVRRPMSATIASIGICRPGPTRRRSSGRERTGEDAEISYRDLHERVSKFANALKGRGVQKGDRVSIYMPMVPEAAVADACLPESGRCIRWSSGDFPLKPWPTGSWIRTAKL